MKTGTRVAGIICCALFAISLCAQNPSSCSPVGTWYGGSDAVKYMLTITPINGEQFAIRADILGTLTNVGIPAFTAWSGQLLRSKGNLYVAHEISLYTSSGTFPPPPESYEMDAVRGYLTFTNCDNIQFTYDFYGVYFNLSAVPFADVPDISIDMTGTVETYQRVPNACAVCGSVASSSNSSHKKR